MKTIFRDDKYLTHYCAQIKVIKSFIAYWMVLNIKKKIVLLRSDCSEYFLSCINNKNPADKRAFSELMFCKNLDRNF